MFIPRFLIIKAVWSDCFHQPSSTKYKSSFITAAFKFLQFCNFTESSDGLIGLEPQRIDGID